MSEEKRSIGYICPVCGQAVVAERTLFQLLAGDSKIPCPCGKSELSIRQMGDRCEVTAPCLFCAKDHRAACANESLRKQKLIALTCGKSGLAICHIGEEGQVFRAMEKLERAVDKLRRDDSEERRGAFLNDVVMGEVLSELRDIAARGGVKCACGCGQYGVTVGYSSVDVICAACGAVLRLPAATQDDIDGICAQYTLTIPGKRGS